MKRAAVRGGRSLYREKGGVKLKILGISEIDNDSGAVLLENGKVLSGINEERLSRVKRHRGFPHLSIQWILESAGLSLEDIDLIAIAKTDPVEDPERFGRAERIMLRHRHFDPNDPSGLLWKLLNLTVTRLRNIPRDRKLASDMCAEIRQWIEHNKCQAKVVRVPHHYAHATCAYWASGYEDALAVTIDGQGEGVTAQVYSVRSGDFELVHEVLMPNSLGNFYGAVTKALGYKPNRHEGKVTGLAAYGKPHPWLMKQVRKLAYFRAGTFHAPTVFGSYPLIWMMAKFFGREQISAAFQQVLEEVTQQFVAEYVKQTGHENVVLAGGVVANVKLNQRIFEIPNIKEVFVFPHMADGGLSYGAAQAVYRDETKDVTREPIEDVYWGPGYNDGEIEASLKSHGVKYRRSEDICKEVAQLLVEGKVVANFDGRMEFGPRALGNRSILYQATDPSVNDWLNVRLHRSEFMPFAPVTLAEKASECYINTAGAEFTAEFMTITFECTEQMSKASPAVVHVDKTARPQLIRREKNPRYYNILEHYYEISGIPSIVNTSFNMHEEPIVCTPDDAIRSFLNGGLDFLAIGPFLVSPSEVRGGPHA